MSTSSTRASRTSAPRAPAPVRRGGRRASVRRSDGAAASRRTSSCRPRCDRRVTVVVISAWKSSGGDHATNEARRRRANAGAHVRGCRPPISSLEGVRGASYVAVHRGGPGRPGRLPGDDREGRDAAVQGQRYWLNVSAPENLDDHGRRQAGAIAGNRPRVITVTPAGWQARAADPPARAAILVTGSELVRGDRNDRNGPYLAQSLLSLGIEPVEVRIVGDAPDELERALRGGARARPARHLGRARPDPRRPHGRAARARGRAAARRSTRSCEREIETWTRQVAERLRRPYTEFAPGVHKQASVPEGAVVARSRGHGAGARAAARRLRRRDAARARRASSSGSGRWRSRRSRCAPARARAAARAPRAAPLRRLGVGGRRGARRGGRRRGRGGGDDLRARLRDPRRPARRARRRGARGRARGCARRAARAVLVRRATRCRSRSSCSRCAASAG